MGSVTVGFVGEAQLTRRFDTGEIQIGVKNLSHRTLTLQHRNDGIKTNVEILPQQVRVVVLANGELFVMSGEDQSICTVELF